MPEVNLGKVVGPRGPQGPTGPEGPQGVQGVPGPKGDPGSGTNPNLLYNWYFADPINQRGQTEYTAGRYTIDRWIRTGLLHVTLESGGVTLRNTGDSNCVWTQALPGGPILGKQFTLSVLDGSGHLFSYTGTATPKETQGAWGSTSIDDDSSAGWCDLYAQSNDIPAGNVHVRFVIRGGESVTVAAVKLEVGDHQTLAHKEGDKWVLNDAPDPALELLRCQRYYLRLTGDASARAKNIILARQAKDYVEFYIPTPVPMRANPTFHIQGDVTLPYDTFLNASGSAVAGENGVYFRVEDTSGDGEHADTLYPAALQFTGDFLELDAEP